ncbi:MAG: type II toxin-antitoxin system HicA family toxin [Anaerolineales bacterium]
MSKRQKLLAKILSGSRNIAFSEILSLAQGFGFRLIRVSGSHHILTHAQVRELLNLQEVGGQVKPYQIRQFLDLIERYDLHLENEK